MYCRMWWHLHSFPNKGRTSREREGRVFLSAPPTPDTKRRGLAAGVYLIKRWYLCLRGFRAAGFKGPVKVIETMYTGLETYTNCFATCLALGLLCG